MATASHIGPVARLSSARWLVGVSILVLLLAWWFFAIPLAFVVAAAMAVIAAALIPLPLGMGQVEPLSPAGVWGTEIGSAAQSLLSALNHPAFLLDRAGIVRFANPEAAVQFAATRRGDPLSLTFRSAEIRGALETPDAPAVVEYREAGRATRIFAVSFGPVSIDGDQGGWILVVVEDASDRFAITRMRADFVANASHELRTPLASLTGFIETLLGSARHDPVATERFLRIMQEQAGRMRRLIDDLLTLSRVETGERRQPATTVDLVPLTREVADTLRSAAAEHSVAITLDAPDAPVNVRGVRDELFQVLGNLMENAIRYGGAGGKVEVSLAGGDAAPATLTVRDYGPGIAPEHVPRLTERFYRVDVGASRSMKGTGLGLAIVKHILSRHSARLEISSEPGHGAAFTVRFPSTANEPKSPAKAAE